VRRLVPVRQKGISTDKIKCRRREENIQGGFSGVCKVCGNEHEAQVSMSGCLCVCVVADMSGHLKVFPTQFSEYADNDNRQQ
jgi:hypothetical protein